MTNLADDIKALMDLGISLERAIELAVADRNKVPDPVYFIEQFPSQIFHICIFAFDKFHLMI